MNVLVIGFGVSGKAATHFLQTLGHRVVVVDRQAEGVARDLPDFPLEGIDLVVLSPGIAHTHPIVQRAMQAQIEVIGEIELGARYLKNRAFGITGSNGKTTTVLLTTHILNQAGVRAKALGNVGDPLCEYLIDADPNEVLIIELSSFQLESLTTKFLEVAIILNITPNHLDRYLSMKEYTEAKMRIAQCVKAGGEFFGPKVFEEDIVLISALEYTKLSMASKQSILASYLLCKRCGVSDVDFLQGLKTFKKPPHRIEWVAKIEGVEYYNDSKSSNVHSVMHAVSQFEGKLVLIVGGVHKGSSYMPWVESFRGKVDKVIAYGKARDVIESELKDHFPLETVDRFKDAVEIARKYAKAGDTVLLSPGCSSYDQFQNYEQRGNEFKRLLRGE